MFILGTEYNSLDTENREEWENAFKQVRNNYFGIVTYAANWDNYNKVCFWDLTDIVGIDAYFSLSKESDPSKQQLIQGWSKWIDEISDFQEDVGKPVLFTEIGYRSTDYSARLPWEYKEVRPVNQELQKRCYESIEEAFAGKEWFKGFFIWNWTPMQDYGGKFNTDFTPQNKLAQDAFLE